jgi:gamma-glutamyltranspeptidase/glutathione hydrolase
MPVLGRRGVVATSDPLAAQAGLRILQRGGNAVDAAIAASTTLTVTEPTSNGIGGDAFALIWDGRKLHGLNGSGRAPATHTRQLFGSLGLDHIPARGWLPVTVPGGPAAWRDMHRRFGRLPLEEIFEPAIEYASGGFPVTTLTAGRWRAAAAIHGAEKIEDPALRPWRDLFTRDGHAPEPGAVWVLPDLATTLRELASTGCESFYRGRLAERIANFASATGGYLTREDLASHESSWDEPANVTYRGHQIWEMPPNSQGIAALGALSVLEAFDLARSPRDSTESYHLQIEAIKAAQADVYRRLGDPAVADVPYQSWLSADSIGQLRQRVGDTAAAPPPAKPPRGGTVYLCAADGDGMMVSFIQSNYSGWLLGFGSGVVVPGTGISLHSRGCGFTLEANHPNVIAPGKRPFHTLAPAFVTKDGAAVGPFGIIGGPIQPQAHVQFAVNQFEYGMNPQAALDAPRFQWLSENRIEVELSVPGDIMQGLLVRGHAVQPCLEFAAVPPRLGPAFLGRGGLIASGDFGRAQIIRREKNGVYVAASDWRGGGCAVAY